jgi:hypothetical protein
VLLPPDLEEPPRQQRRLQHLLLLQSLSLLRDPRRLVVKQLVSSPISKQPVQTDHGVPVLLGILLLPNLDSQANERSDPLRALLLHDPMEPLL